uniref:LRRCT domain-containing protein n=1 Tax=Panagrellus redivivus TaxID=6233 RepID=A0A7E4W1E4_PANRE
MLLFSSLLLLITAISARKSLPSQYEASCFPKCNCNSTTVECKDLHETDTAMFEKILPKIYPDLDTISITGNDFGDLPKENIFGGRSRQLKVSLFDISDNDIRSFASETFFGLPKVEFIYLRNNEIESVGSEPFSYTPAVRVIDLTAGLAARLTPRKKASLIKDMLEAGHNFMHLQEVILSSNTLTELDPDTFCKVEGISRLVLTDNLFDNLNLNPACLRNLKLLDLRKNKIATVPAVIYNTLDLNTIDVSTNPINCECKSEEFIKFANDDSTIFVNQQYTTCAAPAPLAGKTIFALEDANLCQRGSSFFSWLILLLIAGGVLFIYRHLRRTGRLNRMGPIFGYSQLKANDEAATSPAFV